MGVRVGQAIAFINNYTNVKLPSDVEIEFVQPRLSIEVSMVAIVVLLVFTVLLLVNLGYSFKRWWGMCTSDYQSAEGSESRYTFEDEPRMDEEITVLRKLSFEYKFQQYLC